MKNHKWKIILVLLVVLVGCFGAGFKVFATGIEITRAADMAQFDGVTVSPDKQAWTTEYKNQNIIQVPKGYSVYTGVESTLPTLNPGEHFYRVEALGTTPIWRWEVQWANAQCIHSFEAQNYHGFETSDGICKRYYHSGWFAYCAACEEPVAEMYVYASVDTVKGITSLPAQSNYAYICPFCNGLEQGTSYKHMCKKVSNNYYVVRYDANAPKGITATGTMSDTKHMYDNARTYNGLDANEMGYGATKLRKNRFRCVGYTFVGWNENPDGTGKQFSDEDEVLNLCEEDGGHVTLYAQWELAKSTLLIDANGGTYLGEEIYTVAGEYESKFELKEAYLDAPSGFLVYFEPNGGSAVAPMAAKSEFAFWEPVGNFNGRLEGNIYTFLGEEGTTDTIGARYLGGRIVLPDSQKGNALLVGWYLDSELSQEGFLGRAGEEVFVEDEVTLYAKWSELSLWSEENYVAHNGVGAVNLWWQQKNNEKLLYKVFQSEDSDNWRTVDEQEDGGMSISLRELFDVSKQDKELFIPWTGYYQVSAFGGKGAEHGDTTPENGGQTVAEYWLEKGDMIRVHSGERGMGDCSTYVYLTRDGEEHLLITAGGGIGTELVESQTTLLSPAIEDVAFRSNISTMFPSGTGVYVVFNSQSQYPTLKITGEAWAEALGTVRIGDLNRPLETLRTHPYGKVQLWGESIQNIAKENQAPHWGARQTSGGFSRTFVATYPTNGNTNLVVSGAIDTWSANADGDIRFRILNPQTQEVLYDVTKVSGFCNWNGNVLVTRVLTWEDFDISGLEEVTVEVYIKQLSGEGAATNVLVYDTFFYGKTIYETVVTPAGTNYINTGFGCRNPVSTECVNDGDGYAILESADVGYMEDFELYDVYAPDMRSPEKIATYDAQKISDTEVQIEVLEPKDCGSLYYHKVESFRFIEGDPKKVSTSNIVENTLTTGVDGYFYDINVYPISIVTKSHTFVEESQWKLAVTDWNQFVHVAPVDKAGNLGETISISLQELDDVGIFNLEANVFKERAPWEEVFKAGESAALQITAEEYVEHIEVLFPEEWVGILPDMNCSFYYDEPMQFCEEGILFRIPLGIPSRLYEIEVTAYKGDEKLTCRPVVIVQEGSVLDELRTRIRNNG